MKHLLTFVLILLATAFSTVSFAADTFDVSSAGAFAMTAESAATDAEADFELAAPLLFFTHSIRSAASEFLHDELGFDDVHGQPLPGVLISLLLGAAFGAARKFRPRHGSPETDTTAADALPLAARLLRMQILFLNPPQTIHAISPGPDLFCLRE
ncbi:MAG: hypothetical protein J6W70_05865 [Lentisphaeria bacterium]|nr:hypothetical protein [Lentisphaeria bacterium]